jgi:acetyl esterase/lipase
VIPVLLLAFGVASLGSTTTALVRVRRPAAMAFSVMMVSWWVSEYPVFFLVVQVAIAALLRSAADTTPGAIGVAALISSWIGLAGVRFVQTKARRSSERALRSGLGERYLDELDPKRRAVLRNRAELKVVLLPFHFDRSGIVLESNIAYGDEPRNVLDVYRPERADQAQLPVLLQIHGGGWVIGNKRQQALPLLHRMARNGYVAVSINYRLGPRTRFPAQLVDVKRAIAWTRLNIAGYGGDPDTIILTGGSAGGHLASLAALTPNLPEYQPGFETVDTTVSACIPFYGPSDFTDRLAIRGPTSSYEVFLRPTVMPGWRRDHFELYEAMSPITHVNEHAPPFCVIQGSIDVLVWREETAAFAAELGRVSHEPVVYWEVPGAQHAFDVFNSRRSAVAVDACERFAGWVVAHTRAGNGET